MTEDKKYKAYVASNFLKNHPAFYDSGYDTFIPGLYFFMDPRCKNDQSEFQLFDEIDPNTKKTIFKEYNEVYGYPWEYSFMNYRFELSFSVFTGNPYLLDEQYNNTMWRGYIDGIYKATTFEDMLILAAEKTKEFFGDFRREDFYTPEEKNNNEKTNLFLLHQEPPFDSEDDEYPILSELNPDYIDIYDSLINLRWMKWFKETPHAKENWGLELSDWEGFIHNEDFYLTPERKKLLEKYKE